MTVPVRQPATLSASVTPIRVQGVCVYVCVRRGGGRDERRMKAAVDVRPASSLTNWDCSTACWAFA